MRRPLSTAATLAAAALVLAACSGSDDTTPDAPAGEQSASAQSSTGQSTTEQPSEDLLAAHGLQGMDGKEIVDHLDAMPRSERPQDLAASVRAHEVLLSDPAGTEVSVDLPADEFYLSVAPFEAMTHECFYHALTGCVGEQFSTPMQVTVVDSEGTTLVDEEITTFDNGFFGLWLPRDITATLTVEHEGKSGTQEISTGEEDLTCLTTLQLT